MIKKITILITILITGMSLGQTGENATALALVKGGIFNTEVCEAGGKGVIEYPNGWYNSGTTPDELFRGESVDGNWKWNQTVTDIANTFFNGEAKTVSAYGSGDTDVDNMISINNTTDFTLKTYNKRATNNTLTCENTGNKVLRYSLQLTTPFVNPGDIRTVTITVTDTNGASENIVLTTTYNPTAKLDKLEKFNFSYAPNPTKDFIQLSAVNPIQEIKIYNLLGQEIIQNTYNLHSAKVDVSNLNEGVYVLKVIINDSIGTYKFIKE